MKSGLLGIMSTLNIMRREAAERDGYKILIYFIFKSKAFCTVGGEGEEVDG